VATAALPPPDARERAPSAPDCRGWMLFGWLVLAAFVAGFGVWATLAPLSSAAIARGEIEVESNRKTIQHLEGGIIREILVDEGDVVEAGQPLVLLDTTEAESSADSLRGRLTALVALESRLIAERDGQEKVSFPAELEARRGEDEAVAEVLDGQETIFASRRAALSGQVDIHTQRIGQLRALIEAYRAQEESARAQIELVGEELSGVREMVEKGLERKPRLLALEREAERLNGSLGEYSGHIARAEEAIGEARLQIIDIKNQAAERVVSELRDVQTEIATLREKLRYAEDVLTRRSIVAPVKGMVVELRHFTPGGVIAPGAPIMDLVPLGDELIVNAKLRPSDIDVVHAGLVAQVRLTAYSRRRTPTLSGRVLTVSADSLTDERTGIRYFLARVRIDADELSRVDDVHLYPGMPADVMIVTGEQTFLDYLLKPVQDSFARAFREG
jgi:HlyD family type I secretion membrane fusion protein